MPRQTGMIPLKNLVRRTIDVGASCLFAWERRWIPPTRASAPLVQQNQECLSYRPFDDRQECLSYWPFDDRQECLSYRIGVVVPVASVMHIRPIRQIAGKLSLT